MKKAVCCSVFTGPLKVLIKHSYMHYPVPGLSNLNFRYVICVVDETTRFYDKGEVITVPAEDLYLKVEPTGKFGNLLYTGRPDYSTLPVLERGHV